MDAPIAANTAPADGLTLVVAADKRDGIGHRGGLPWHLPNDLRFFKRVTNGHPLIMGRKTHESIGRALPGRPNIVISRDPHYTPFEGALCAGSLDAALGAAHEALPNSPVMVIGGEQIFRLALPWAARLYLTRIHGEYPADTLLPAIDWEHWREIWREDQPTDEKNEVAHSFILYERCGA